MGNVGSGVCGLNIRTSPRLLLLSGGVTLNQFVGSCLMNFTAFLKLFFNHYSCNDTLLIAATQNLQAELVSNVSVHQTSKRKLYRCFSVKKPLRRSKIPDWLLHTSITHLSIYSPAATPHPPMEKQTLRASRPIAHQHSFLTPPLPVPLLLW